MKKSAVALVLVFLLVNLGAASSIGSFVSGTEKNIDSYSTEFTISVFNLGNDPVKLDVSSKDARGATIRHPDTISIGPSKVTRNPQEEDISWFLLDDGRYVQVIEIPVEVDMHRQRRGSSLEFTVDLKATEEIESRSPGAIQNLAQVRSYTFNVNTDAHTVDPGPQQNNVNRSNGLIQNAANTLNGLGQGIGNAVSGSGLTDSGTEEIQDTGSGSGSGETGTDDSDSSGSTSTDRGLQPGESSQQENRDSGGSTTGSFLQAAGANKLTLVLMMFIFMSGFYLFRVM